MEAHEFCGGPGMLWRPRRSFEEAQEEFCGELRGVLRAMLRGVLFAQELTGIFSSPGNCFPLFRSLFRDRPLWIMM